MFQPDGVIAFEWEGHTYLVTANEGDDREYEADDLGLDEDWVESERGDDIVQCTYFVYRKLFIYVI